MEIVTLESQSIYAHESCLGQYYILDNMSQKLDMQLDKYRSRDYQEGVFQDNYDCACVIEIFLIKLIFWRCKIFKE
jgi:hypothetical protein